MPVRLNNLVKADKMIWEMFKKEKKKVTFFT